MNVRRHGLFAVAMLAAAAGGARAQRADSAARPPRADTTSQLACARSGATARLWTGAQGDSAGRTRAGAAAGMLSNHRMIDTVVTLNVTDRTWQRDSVSAGVALGVAGSAGARRSPWYACAGATATLGRVTATLHNVRGQIHLKADPGALDAIGGSAGRTTPPAPPRR